MLIPTFTCMKLNDVLIQALHSETDERKILFEHYVKMLEDLQKAKLLIEEQEKRIRFKISEYRNGSSIDSAHLSSNRMLHALGTIVKSSDYPIAGSWRDKIIYVMKRSDKALTGKEIIDRLKVLQPELSDKNINSSIHPTLSDNSGEGKKFKKIVDEVTNTNRYELNK